MRKFFITSAVLAIVLAFILGIWEARRRLLFSGVRMQQLVAGEPARALSELNEVDPKAVEAACRDANQFARILDEARLRVAAATERNMRLVHTETQLARELDPKGKSGTTERHVENIWFEDGQERRQTIEKINVERNKPKPGVDYGVRKSPVVQETFPLTKSGVDDGYGYSFAGVEELDGAWMIRVDFEPLSGQTGRFRGQFWIDAKSREPRRFYGEFADKKPFLDQFSILVDYGIAENGCVQALRSVVDGSGGFAMIQKHIRSDIRLHDYREPGSGPPAQVDRTARK